MEVHAVSNYGSDDSATESDATESETDEWPVVKVEHPATQAAAAEATTTPARGSWSNVLRLLSSMPRTDNGFMSPFATLLEQRANGLKEDLAEESISVSRDTSVVNEDTSAASSSRPGKRRPCSADGKPSKRIFTLPVEGQRPAEPVTPCAGDSTVSNASNNDSEVLEPESADGEELVSQNERSMGSTPDRQYSKMVAAPVKESDNTLNTTVQPGDSCLSPVPRAPLIDDDQHRSPPPDMTIAKEIECSVLTSTNSQDHDTTASSNTNQPSATADDTSRVQRQRESPRVHPMPVSQSPSMAKSSSSVSKISAIGAARLSLLSKVRQTPALHLIPDCCCSNKEIVTPGTSTNPSCQHCHLQESQSPRRLKTAPASLIEEGQTPPPPSPRCRVSIPLTEVEKPSCSEAKSTNKETVVESRDRGGDKRERTIDGEDEPQKRLKSTSSTAVVTSVPEKRDIGSSQHVPSQRTSNAANQPFGRARSLGSTSAPPTQTPAPRGNCPNAQVKERHSQSSFVRPPPPSYADLYEGKEGSRSHDRTARRRLAQLPPLSSPRRRQRSRSRDRESPGHRSRSSRPPRRDPSPERPRKDREARQPPPDRHLRSSHYGPSERRRPEDEETCQTRNQAPPSHSAAMKNSSRIHLQHTEAFSPSGATAEPARSASHRSLSKDGEPQRAPSTQFKSLNGAAQTDSHVNAIAAPAAPSRVCARCSSEIRVQDLKDPNASDEEVPSRRCECCEEVLTLHAFDEQNQAEAVSKCISCSQPPEVKKKKTRKKKFRDCIKEIVDCTPEKLCELREIAAEAQTLLAQHSGPTSNAASDERSVALGILRPEIQDLIDKRMEQITKYRRAMMHNDVFLGDVEEVGEMLRAPLRLDWSRIGVAEATMLVRQVLVCSALLKTHGVAPPPTLQRVVDEYTSGGWEKHVMKGNLLVVKIGSSTTAIATAIRLEIQRRAKEAQVQSMQHLQSADVGSSGV